MDGIFRTEMMKGLNASTIYLEEEELDCVFNTYI